MGIFSKNSDSKKVELSNVMPVRNTNLKVEKDSNGEILVTAERKKAWWVSILSLIFYLPKKRVINLDRIGTEVYDMCDGRNSIENIIEKFSSVHKLNRRETEVSVVTYLKRLGKKGLLGFLINE